MISEVATIARGSRRRASLPIALLAATAALAGGVQAIAPAPAAAMVNEGEECDPLTTIDCEPANGGGGGGSVGTTDGGGVGDSEIIGEAIYVEGALPTPPSSCRASSCLPSQIGGGSTGFLDRGGRSARGPHPHGRPTRVGEVAKGKAPTKAECDQLKAGRLKLPAEVRLIALLKVQDEQRVRLERLVAQEVAISRQMKRLKAALERLARQGWGTGDFALMDSDRIQLAALTQAYQSVRAQEEPIEAQRAAGDQQLYALTLKNQAERAAFLKRCDELFGKRT